MMTNIVDCDLDTVRIGDAVRLVFKDSDHGQAVPMFRPILGVESTRDRMAKIWWQLLRRTFFNTTPHSGRSSRTASGPNLSLKKYMNDRSRYVPNTRNSIKC